jgi:hypothetical protein
LKFSSGGLVCDCGYLSLDNFAAIETDPDAGAYAVIHFVSILALCPSNGKSEFSPSARLSEVTQHIGTLSSEDHERDIPRFRGSLAEALDGEGSYLQLYGSVGVHRREQRSLETKALLIGQQGKVLESGTLASVECVPIGFARRELPRVIEDASFDPGTSGSYQRFVEVLFATDCSFTAGVISGGAWIDAQRSVPKAACEFVFTGIVPHIGCDRSSGTNYAVLLGECAIKCNEIQCKTRDGHVEACRRKRQEVCVGENEPNPRLLATPLSGSEIVS